jgi:periplasmic copper chaperone A
VRRAMRRRASWILPAALLLAAAGCGTRAAEPPAAAGLEVREPRASLQQDTGAVYLTVVNPGPEGDRLLRVETAAARLAETHESVVGDGGVVRMVARPEGFEVPAGGTLALEPGGKHVMLIEPRAAAGATGIALTLHFERAGAIEVQAALASPASPAMDHSGHDMDHSGHSMDHGAHAPAATGTAPPPSPPSPPSPTPSPEPR